MFVDQSGWKLAKTMLGIPHQYTVRDLETPAAARTTAMGHAEFEWFARLTLDEGVRRKWGRYFNAYLIVGEWEYWTMGLAPEVTTIINRQAMGDAAKEYIRGLVSAEKSRQNAEAIGAG